MTDRHALGIEDEEGVVIHEHFDCSKEELWQTVTDPDELAAWLGGGCAIEPRVGGAVRFELPEDGVVATGTIREWSPPNAVNTLAGFEHTYIDEAEPGDLYVCGWWLIPKGDGCDLRFTLQAVDDAKRSTTPAGPWARLGSAIAGPPPQRHETPIDEAVALLREANDILLVDWVTPDIPRRLVEAGFNVVSKNGPEPDDFGRAAVVDGALTWTKVAPPASADLLHLDWTIDFHEYLALARSIGVRTFWYHSAQTKPPAPADVSGTWVPARKSARLRAAAKAAGMNFVDDHYILTVAARL
jgi:hypothetical protein